MKNFLIKTIFFVLILLLLYPINALALDDCPFGKTNGSCEYPGECGRYIDLDDNQICDHSQSELENKNVKDEEETHDNYGVEPSVAKDIASTRKTGGEIEISESKENIDKTVYPIFSVILVLILLYLTTLILSTKKIISVLLHKRIWNVLLLITFLGTGLLGILLVIRINYGTIFPLFFNILYWHVELGIAMAVISVFHIIERWYFFKNMLNKK